MVTLTDVQIVYDNAIEAVREGSLTLSKGSIVALLGANGAGKSTTLQAISGVDRPVSRCRRPSRRANLNCRSSRFGRSTP